MSEQSRGAETRLHYSLLSTRPIRLFDTEAPD